jgi:hypothetical protein
LLFPICRTAQHKPDSSISSVFLSPWYLWSLCPSTFLYLCQFHVLAPSLFLYLSSSTEDVPISSYLYLSLHLFCLSSYLEAVCIQSYSLCPKAMSSVRVLMPSLFVCAGHVLMRRVPIVSILHKFYFKSLVLLLSFERRCLPEKEN